MLLFGKTEEQKICDDLTKIGLTKIITSKTGASDPYFSATKISWILDNIDNAKQLSLGHKLGRYYRNFLLFKFTEGKASTQMQQMRLERLYNIHEISGIMNY